MSRSAPIHSKARGNSRAGVDLQRLGDGLAHIGDGMEVQPEWIRKLRLASHQSDMTTSSECPVAEDRSFYLIAEQEWWGWSDEPTPITFRLRAVDDEDNDKPLAEVPAIILRVGERMDAVDELDGHSAAAAGFIPLLMDLRDVDFERLLVVLPTSSLSADAADQAGRLIGEWAADMGLPFILAEDLRCGLRIAGRVGSHCLYRSRS